MRMHEESITYYASTTHNEGLCEATPPVVLEVNPFIDPAPLFQY